MARPQGVLSLKNISSRVSSYETIELKLAALLLAEIPESTLKVSEVVNAVKKTIKIIYSVYYENHANEIIAQFINRQARVDVYRYNQSLNRLRDALNESKDGKDG